MQGGGMMGAAGSLAAAARFSFFLRRFFWFFVRTTRFGLAAPPPLLVLGPPAIARAASPLGLFELYDSVGVLAMRRPCLCQSQRQSGAVCAVWALVLLWLARRAASRIDAG